MHEIEVVFESGVEAKLLKKLAEEFSCDFNQTWTSKHNSYVKYDYPPYDPTNFVGKGLISSQDYAKLQFVMYLYNKYLDTLNVIKTVKIEPEQET